MGGGDEHMSSSSSEPVYPDFKGHLFFAWSYDEPKDVVARIQHRYPSLRITYQNIRKDGVISRETFRSITILSTFNSFPSNPADLASIDFVHLVSAGSDHLVNDPIYKDSDIRLTSSSGIHGPSIAEWVILTILSHAHRFPTLLSWRDAGHFPPRPETSAALAGVRDYAGQTLAVLGYGSIGRQTARVAAGLGMRVIAYTASPRPDAASRRDAGFIVPGTGDAEGSIPSAWFSGTDKASLHTFLSQDIDVLLISVPLTKSTTHLIGEAEFSLLGRASGRKPLLVNIARGKIVVQEALVKSLHAFEDSKGEKGLRGAALDVTDPEPLPDGDALWSAPNVFVSPHCSALTQAYNERSAMLLEGNLERWRKGETLWNVIDRERGY